MKEGDIVLTALPQVDGKVKTRPALLLRLLPLPYSDYLIFVVLVRNFTKELKISMKS